MNFRNRVKILSEDEDFKEELRIRKEMLDEFNKTRDDFPNDAEYENYRELVEELISKKKQGVDREWVFRIIEDNRRTNKALMERNRMRKEQALRDFAKRIEVRAAADAAALAADTAAEHQRKARFAESRRADEERFESGKLSAAELHERDKRRRDALSAAAHIDDAPTLDKLAESERQHKILLQRAGGYSAVLVAERCS